MTDSNAAAGNNAGDTGNAPWYQGHAGIDTEMVGHMANKGWDKLPVQDVAAQALKAWNEAERHVGIPADQLLRMPKDAADPQWETVYNRLGRPEKPEGYDFNGVKFADGTDLDESFTNLMRDVAYKNGVSSTAATAIASEFAKYLETAEQTEAGEKTAALALEKETLNKNWGQNASANMVVAQNAARALGVDADTIAALEGQIGYAKVMEMFRSIGARIGEDKYVAGNGQGNDIHGVMSKDQAVARMADLKKDSAFVKRYLDGDRAATQEMHSLSRIIAGV